jgi:hypothetical protein
MEILLETQMGKPTLNGGLNLFILTIFGITFSWLSMPLPLLVKRPIENENTIRNASSFLCLIDFHSSTFSHIFTFYFYLTLPFLFLTLIFVLFKFYICIDLQCLLTFINCWINLAGIKSYTHLLVHIHLRSSRLPTMKVFGPIEITEFNQQRSPP